MGIPLREEGDPLQESSWVKTVVQTAGPFPVALGAVYGAVQLAGTSSILSGGALLLGFVAFGFGALGLLRDNKGEVAAPASAENPDPTPAVLTPQMNEVASPELQKVSPPLGITALEWVIYTNLKSDPSAALGREGDIAAKYFVDLRRAALRQDH